MARRGLAPWLVRTLLASRGRCAGETLVWFTRLPVDTRIVLYRSQWCSIYIMRIGIYNALRIDRLRVHELGS